MDIDNSLNTSDRPVKPRSLAEMHRDIWRCVWRSPVFLIMIPLIIEFPFDWASEIFYQYFEKTTPSKIRAYFLISVVIDLFVYGFVVAWQTEVLRRMAAAETIELKPVYKASSDLYGTVLGIMLLALKKISWRLLLIVPGVMMMCRLALATPIAVFEGKNDHDSLKASDDYMTGHKGRYFGYSVALFAIYGMLIFGAAYWFPDEASPLVEAMGYIPINALAVMGVIISVLFYLDVRQLSDAYPKPVGTSREISAVETQPDRESSGRLGVLLVAVLAISLCSVGIYRTITAPYYDGTLIEFGEQQHEIYYQDDIPLGHVQQIIDVLQTSNFFMGEEYHILKLEVVGDDYVIHLSLYEENWTDVQIRLDLQSLTLSLNELSLDKGLRLYLLDDWTDETREVPLVRQTSTPG